MARYIIEKAFLTDYGHGYTTLKENNNPIIFTSEDEAFDWLVKNDKDIWIIPVKNIIDYYNIKQI